MVYESKYDNMFDYSDGDSSVDPATIRCCCIELEGPSAFFCPISCVILLCRYTLLLPYTLCYTQHIRCREQGSYSINTCCKTRDNPDLTKESLDNLDKRIKENLHISGYDGSIGVDDIAIGQKQELVLIHSNSNK